MSCSLRCPHIRVSSIKGSTVQSHEPATRRAEPIMLEYLLFSTAQETYLLCSLMYQLCSKNVELCSSFLRKVMAKQVIK